MAYFIEINGLPDSPQRITLAEKSGTIGSGASCEIPIAHAEVADQALLIDVRGDDFWVQNLNTYSIYVGMDEVTRGAWAPWTTGDTIQLTKSVSLLIGEQEDAVEGEAKGEASGSGGLDASKILQMVIIVVCLVAAVAILLNNPDETGGEIDRGFNFNETVDWLETNNDDVEFVTVRKYLQQAWMADRRFRNRQPAAVMKYYELLINHRLVKDNPNDDENLKEISDYAMRRLASLRFKN
jgi:hypothetical protein